MSSSTAPTSSRDPLHAIGDVVVGMLLIAMVCIATLSTPPRDPVPSPAEPPRMLRIPALDPVDADLRVLLRRLPALRAAAIALDDDAVRAPLASDPIGSAGDVPIISGTGDGAVLVRIPVRRSGALIAISETRLALTALGGLLATEAQATAPLLMLDADRTPVFAVHAAAHRAQARIAEWLYRTDPSMLPAPAPPAAPAIMSAAAKPDTPVLAELALLALAASLAGVLIARLGALQRMLDGARYCAG